MATSVENTDQDDAIFPSFHVDFGEGRVVLNASTAKQMSNWIQKEIQFWDRALPHPDAIGDNQLKNMITGFITPSAEIQAFCAQWEADPDGEEGYRNQIQSQLDHYTNRFVLHSSTPDAQFIKSLFETEETPTALAALATALGHSINNLQQPKIFYGVQRYFLHSHGVDTETALANDNALKEISKRYRDQHATDFQETEDLITTLDKRAKWETKKSQARQRRFKKNWTTFTGKMQADVEKAIESIQDVEKTYSEKMRLKAAFDYWDQKANDHKEKASACKRNIISYAKKGGGALAVALLLIAVWAINLDQAQDMFILGAVGLFASTIVIWAGRILVRLYLSEHHLAIDAEERAVMVLTYLALTEQGQADEADRAIVLSSLFRPTTDGLIKDDASPDISLASLASRLAAKD